MKPKTNSGGNSIFVEKYRHEPFFATPQSVVRRLRERSVNARRFIDLLEDEHMNHGGQRNGSLIVTYRQCVKAGISSRLVKAAIDECGAAGLVEITRPGGRHLPTFYRLTWFPIGPTTSRKPRKNNHHAAPSP